MADAIVGNTELVATKMDLIAEVAQRELKFSAKLLPTVRDVSSFAGKGSKTIEFPKMASFTALDRVSGAQGDAAVLLTSNDVLALDKNKYIAWIIDSSDEIQSRLNVQAEYAGRAASAHGRAMDNDIIAAAEAVGKIHGADLPITEDDVLNMREYILSNEGDLSRTFLVVGTAQEKELLKITRFSSNDIYGRPVIPQGMLGNIHGVTVIVHNGVVGNKAYMYDSEGIAFGLQSGPNVSDQGANEFGANARRFAMDQLYGISGMQVTDATLTIGNAALGESALVAKLF